MGCGVSGLSCQCSVVHVLVAWEAGIKKDMFRAVASVVVGCLGVGASFLLLRLWGGLAARTPGTVPVQRWCIG